MEESGRVADDSDAFLQATISLALNGDSQAVKQLIANFTSVIQREIRTQRRFLSLQSRMDPEDVYQSVWGSFFVALLSGDVIFKRSREVAAYLAQSVRNKIQSRLRHHEAAKRDVRRTISAGELELEDPTQQSPAKSVGMYETLQMAMKSLSAEELEVARRRLAGVAWEQLAAEMGISADTLRKRHARALERVRAQLDEQ